MRWMRSALLAFLAVPSSFAQSPPKANRPKPPPAAVLEGVVKGPDGKPVDQAVVTARPSTGGATDDARTDRTDAQGRFRLVLKARTPQTLRVDAKGLAGRTLNRVAPGSPVSVVLDRGGFVDGVVRDGKTGEPLPKATVRATDEQLLGFNRASDADIPSSEATTDAKGRFRIEGVGTGGHRIAATARGYGLASKPAVAAGRSIELFLFPGGWIAGTVLGPDGRPVAGVVVRAETEAGPFAASGGTARSDASGRFELTGLAGTYRLVATHPDHAPAATPNVWVEKGAETRADIVLTPAGAVSGRLVDSSGEPVSGAVSVQELDGLPVTSGLASLLRAEAGGDGRFRIERVPAGSHALAVFGRGCVPKRVEIEVDARSPRTDLGDVALDAGLTIRGQVRDRAGEPVASARVSGSGSRRSAVVMSGTGPEARTEADGSFVLVVPSPGDYRLTASAAGYAPASRQAEAGAENVELALDAAGAITGLVVDEKDGPLEVFRVVAQATRREERPGPISPRIPGEPEGAGRFTVPDIAEGGYVLEITAPDRATATVSDVKVTAGGRVDVGRVRLLPGGSVRGSVVDANGRPLMGASVTAQVAGRERIRYGDDPRATTDAAGLFELKGLAAGTVDLQASHPQFADGRASGVEVDPVKGPAEVRIVLSQGGRIEGTVRRRDGAGVSGARIQLIAPASGLLPAGTTRPDGSFVLEHVAAGRVMVVLLARMAGGLLTGQETKEVDVREGETTVVEILSREILVSGRVTRGGQPAGGLRIALQGRMTLMLRFGPASAEVPSGSGERLAGVSREDGGYELIANEPGKYTANVYSMDGRLSYASRTVEIPDAEAFSLDFDFAGFPLAGVVLDDETGQPVAEAVVSAEKDKDSPPPRATTGPDGRFYLELDPGRYKLEARAQGYEARSLDVSVSAETAGDVRFSLSRGSGLTGRVVNAGGRGVGGMQVTALARDGERRLRGGDFTLSDGSFQLTGLYPRPYTLLAGSELGGFALRTGVKPGGPPLTLTLQPGGRVRVRVRGTDGQPVEGAVIRAENVGGVEVPDAAQGRTVTDAEGVAEFAVPAGAVELRATKDSHSGAVTVNAQEGVTMPAEVELSETAPARRP